MEVPGEGRGIEGVSSVHEMVTKGKGGGGRSERREVSSEKRGGVRSGWWGRRGVVRQAHQGRWVRWDRSGRWVPLLRQAQDRLRQAQGRPLRQAQGRFSGDAGMWFDSALRRLRAGSP